MSVKNSLLGFPIYSHIESLIFKQNMGKWVLLCCTVGHRNVCVKLEYNDTNL